MNDSAFRKTAGNRPAENPIRSGTVPEAEATPYDAASPDAASPDAAIAAFHDFLAARRRYNRLPAEAGQADPAGVAAAWGAYDRADAAMRDAPIASARGARAALSYLLIGLESFEPGSWSTPVFHNMMRFLRRLPAERR